MPVDTLDLVFMEQHVAHTKAAWRKRAQSKAWEEKIHRTHRPRGRGDRVSDARWLEVEDDLASAADHFGKAVELFGRGGFDADDISGYAARMAFLHSMFSAHTSLESGLNRTLAILGEDRPSGERWHEDLIRRVSREISGQRPAIFDAETADLADQTRRFRHIAVESYNHFKPQEAATAVAAAAALAERILPVFARFRAAIDPA